MTMTTYERKTVLPAYIEPIGDIDMDVSRYVDDERYGITLTLASEIQAKGEASGYAARIGHVATDDGWVEVSALGGEWGCECGYRVRDNNGQMDIIVADIAEAAEAIATFALA